MQNKPRLRGRIVKTKSDKIGIVYSHEAKIGGKLRVHCEDGEKLLCDPKTLQVIGFSD